MQGQPGDSGCNPACLGQPGDPAPTRDTGPDQRHWPRPETLAPTRDPAPTRDCRRVTTHAATPLEPLERHQRARVTRLHPVTPGHTRAARVTLGHTRSHSVTLGHTRAACRQRLATLARAYSLGGLPARLRPGPVNHGRDDRDRHPTRAGAHTTRFADGAHSRILPRTRVGATRGGSPGSRGRACRMGPRPSGACRPLSTRVDPRAARGRKAPEGRSL